MIKVETIAQWEKEYAPADWRGRREIWIEFGRSEDGSRIDVADEVRDRFTSVPIKAGQALIKMQRIIGYLLDDRIEMLKMLRGVEWGTGGDCPVCGAVKGPHSPGCQLDAVLSEEP